MKQFIDMRELKQAQQTGCDTTEHNLAASAKRLEASDKRAQTATIDELKHPHIHYNTFVPTLHQVDKLGFKLWGKIGVQPFGMDLDDDNISTGLGRKWHRTSSQERRRAWRSPYDLAGQVLFAATQPWYPRANTSLIDYLWQELESGIRGALSQRWAKMLV